MDVQVRHGLPGSWAVVDADVEAIGSWAALLQLGTGLIQQLQQAFPLWWCQFEERSNVPVRDDEGMSRGDRKGVAYDHAMCVADQHPLGW